MEEERETGLLLPLRRESRRLAFLDGVPGSMEGEMTVVARSKPAAARCRGWVAALAGANSDNSGLIGVDNKASLTGRRSTVRVSHEFLILLY